MIQSSDMLNCVLEERDRIFPKRDEVNNLEMHRLLDEFFDHVDGELNSDWMPENTLVETVQSLGDNPLFLCGYMKSGTTLLLELLDGHRELIVLPGDSFMINKVTRKDRDSNFIWKEWQRNWIKRMVNPTGQKPFWILGRGAEPYAEFLQYLEYWFASLPEGWRKPVLSTVFSYFCANSNRPTRPKMWVEKTPGNEFRVEQILDLFPNAKFVHIVRDPRENMASLKKLYQSRSWNWNPGEVARTIARSCRSAVINQKRLGRERYNVLSYESLTENPEEVMRNIVDFSGICWDRKLLKPTINSIPATANSMYKDRQVTGVVRRAQKDKWRQVLSEAEQRVILRTLPDARKVGYNWNVGVINSIMMWLQTLTVKS